MSELPPRAEVLDALRFAVAPAAGATLAVAGLAGVALWRLTPHWRRAMPAVSALALAAGLAAGNHFRGSLPWSPDAAWWHWAGPAIVLALLAELPANVRGVSGEVGHLLRGLAAGVAAAAVTPPDWQAEARWTFPLLATVLAAEWGVLVAVGRRHGGGTTALTMGLVAAGAAAVLAHHHDLRFTDLAVFTHAGLVTLAGFAWLTRTDASPAAAAAAVPVVGVLMMSRFLGDESGVRWGCFAAVGLAPLALAPLLAVPRRLWAAVLAVLLVAAPVGWAVATAMRDAPLKFDLSEKWDG